jgi:hypothetical protein
MVSGGSQRNPERVATMMMRRFDFCRVIVISMAMLIDPYALYGCGPSMPSVIFTYSLHPDFPLNRYARGELGVLQPTYARSYLLVAYRHMSGAGVDSREEKALVSLWRERLLIDDEPSIDKAMNQWLDERNKITGAGHPTKIDYHYAAMRNNYYATIETCRADGFRTATRTLRARVKQFGAAGATVIAWVQAQDQVFANCAGVKEIPSPLPADAPPLTRADRAYQIAAANFYASFFDESSRLFDEIAKDGASPWRGIAPLLVARSLIRDATLGEKDQKEKLTQAEARLKQILDDPSLSATHASARRLIGFVRYRLAPEKRVRELAREVLRKNAGASIKQDVIDYTRLLDRYEDENHKVTMPASAKRDDITDWLFTFQTEDGEALRHSLQRWDETSSLWWMIASLVKIDAKHPKAAALLDAATKVQPGSPAFATAAYHSVRLMSESGRRDDARQRLDELLETPMQTSVRNQFLTLRTGLARSAAEFFKFARRAPAAVEYSDDLQEVPATERSLSEAYIYPGINSSFVKPFLAGRESFDEDSVEVMNKALPIDVLKDAALGAELPAHLRRQLAIAAWTRAVLLDDDGTATALAPALLVLAPEMKAQLDAYLATQNSMERKDAAVYMILKFPGMRPHVDVGMARLTKHARIDDYRGNWWCGVSGESGDKPELPGFLNDAQRSALAAERRKLEALQIGGNDLCIRAVEWAKRSPTDPRVPEALHLAIKATRFGCRDKQTQRYSRLAFDTLHKQYPNSAWAKKTKYYYGYGEY